MTPKDLAVKDIKDDLMKENKAFLAFHNELNPAMRKIVFSQIKEQIAITDPFKLPVRHKFQLTARCFFCKTTGKVKLVNYSDGVKGLLVKNKVYEEYQRKNK